MKKIILIVIICFLSCKRKETKGIKEPKKAQKTEVEKENILALTPKKKALF
ncbi:hypothetical protein [Flavobacterium sp. UBA7680]|uniref:hypothetical protein n=1 Tax=Flavobacterium sp. UBA7680 TaxID=1946559 RepID=UPI0025C6440D|nr:hypothetical protein [Flavobacterium sp. UBA7680]